MVVKVDGHKKVNLYNGNPRRFSNVRVYVGDKYHPSANAEIKNLYAFSSGKGKYTCGYLSVIISNWEL